MEIPIHTLLYRAAHRQRNALRPHLRELGLGPGQPRLLANLAGHGTVSQKQLAEWLEVDPSAVCRMLDTLERGGFVTRRADRTDRRADAVGITEKGRRAVEEWQRIGRDVDRQILRGFSEEEIRQFAGFLERVRGNLAAAQDGPDARATAEGGEG